MTKVADAELGGGSPHRARQNLGLSREVTKVIGTNRPGGEFLAAQEGDVSYGPAIPLSSKLVVAVRAVLAANNIRVIIVDRSAIGSGPVVGLFDEAVGPATVSRGHISLWMVKAKI